MITRRALIPSLVGLMTLLGYPVAKNAKAASPGRPTSFVRGPDSRILQVFPSGLWIESVRLRLNRSGVRGEFHPKERRFIYGYYESASDGEHHNLVMSRQFGTCDEAVTAGGERFGFGIPARLKNDADAAITRFSEVFPHGLHIHTGLSITK